MIEEAKAIRIAPEAEGGTIDKYIGDALMAFWGAPEIQADLVYPACRAALAISKSVQAENAMRKKRGNPPICLCTGPYAGPVVVRNIGSPERINYTIVGNTVNISQRFEALGKDIATDIPVTILVSDAVREAAEAEFEFQLVGDMPVKGRAGAIRVYQLRADMSAVSNPAH